MNSAISGQPLEIRYKARRMDLLRALWHNLRHSARTRTILLCVCAGLFAWFLLIDFSSLGRVTSASVWRAAWWVLGVLVVLPIVLLLTAKTSERRLSIDKQGLVTSVGRRHGEIAWKKIDSVEETPEGVVITGKNANLFAIPNTAFADEHERAAFVQLARQYLSRAQA